MLLIGSTLGEIADFFLPRQCINCKGEIESDDPLLCGGCQKQLIYPSPEIVHKELQHMQASDVLDGFFPLYKFEQDTPIQNIIHELKYNQRFKIGIEIGKNIAKKYRAEFAALNIDYVVPIPLHRVKKAERGYNQSFYIAKGIAKFASAKITPGVLKRVRFTKSQTTFNREQRIDNVRGAFEVSKRKKVFGKNILLVDDVVTTGSTAKECAGVLIESGAAKIYLASIAMA